jgi:3',5'-cyclic-AMP phosphodiesterase
VKFAFFTDIHLCQGTDSKEGFLECLDSMISHEPQFLVNGGDLGITPEAISFYKDATRDLPMPLYLCNGNHEMCSGFVPQEEAGVANRSIDSGGVHLIILDVVRSFEPTENHPWNWYGLADDAMLSWLAEDLARLDRQTPVVVASHIPLSTSFPVRKMGQHPGVEFPTNEVTNAPLILDLLKPFSNVATLHGHDHENCRHFAGGVEVMTTAAVAGDWWKNGWNSRIPGSREPQGYRVVDIAEDGAISSRYIPFVSGQSEPAELFRHVESGRKFVNVFDGSPLTSVAVSDVGVLPVIDPHAASSKGLSTHLYELPAGFDRRRVDVHVRFEDGRSLDLTLDGTDEPVFRGAL